MLRKNDLSLRAVSSFVAVVECGGIARAARELGFSQPAVSLQLQHLEQRLGVKLFERRGRQVHLTAAGQHALAAARNLLSALSALEAAVLDSKALDAPSLVVGAIEPTASDRLPRVLANLRAATPGVEVKIFIAGGDALAHAARSGSIHVALTVPAQIPGWAFEPLFTERLVALVPANHRLARQASVSLSQMASEPLLLTDETCVYRRTIERAFLRIGVRPSRVTESSSLASLPSGASAGLGLAIVPKPIGKAPSGLRVIAIRERLDVTIGLLRPRTFDEASALGTFIASAGDLRRLSR